MHAHELTDEEIAALKIPDGRRLAEIGTPMLPNGAFRLKWVEKSGSYETGADAEWEDSDGSWLGELYRKPIRGRSFVMIVPID